MPVITARFTPKQLSDLALDYFRQAITLETRAARAACESRHAESADLFAAAELCWVLKNGLDRAAQVAS